MVCPTRVSRRPVVEGQAQNGRAVVVSGSEFNERTPHPVSRRSWCAGLVDVCVIRTYMRKRALVCVCKCVEEKRETKRNAHRRKSQNRSKEKPLMYIALSLRYKATYFSAMSHTSVNAISSSCSRINFFNPSFYFALNRSSV